MDIAKIVSSNSHIDYIAQVFNELDVSHPPTERDYGFGLFVEMPANGERVIAAVYDSQLINPDYANFGPRLSPKTQLRSFSPDIINEQGVLLGLILLGRLDADGNADHSLPRTVVMPGTVVKTLGDEDFIKFHTAANGESAIHYYPMITQHAAGFAVPLLDIIIKRLADIKGGKDAETLQVLSDSLRWQNTFAGKRL